MNLTPNHTDRGMQPWWMTCNVVTWLVFLRNTKKICNDLWMINSHVLCISCHVISLLPCPWTRWTWRSNTTSTHEPSDWTTAEAAGNRMGEREWEIAISLMYQFNVEKLSSCIHFCIPYPNGNWSRVRSRRFGTADALISFIHTRAIVRSVKNSI